MLCTILRPMQAAMTGHEFQNFMGTFLWYAADLPGFPLGKVYNYAWSAGTTIASIVALVLLWNDRGSTSFVLTAIGLGIVIVGMPIVSNVWKTPTYNLIVLGPIGYASGDWQRYFTINWIPLAVTWAAFAVFILALSFL
jgi:hypothetical protein